MSTIEHTPPNFIDCLMMAIHWPGFVEEYDRLEGSHLAQLARRSPIDQMVDEATGYANAEVVKFIKFVKEEVWDRYPGPRRGAI